ncbi:tetraacyldisaccharide 4'-kinase [Candidatus Omnitrophota bacterium]
MKEYLYSLATDKSRGLLAGVLKFILFILSLIYGLAIRMLSFFYCLKPYRFNCRVISVGNITLGGTGKTLLVEMLAGLLKKDGHRVAVLSRGYKRPGVAHPVSGESYEAMGDEPYMLSRNLGDIPVIVDKHRARAAKKAIRDYQVDTVILDDGFQQWKIKKDLEIVTIDATNPFGNLSMLPRGVLREPLSSLRRADIFVLTKTNFTKDSQKIKNTLNRISPGCLIFQGGYKPEGFYRLDDSAGTLLGPEAFAGRQAGLLCGIADPESFAGLIRNLGIGIGISFKFPDHHQYTKAELDRVAGELKKRDIKLLITTEKDYVRLEACGFRLSAISCYIMRIRMELTENEAFIKRIRSLY